MLFYLQRFDVGTDHAAMVIRYGYYNPTCCVFGVLPSYAVFGDKMKEPYHVNAFCFLIGLYQQRFVGAHPSAKSRLKVTRLQKRLLRHISLIVPQLYEID